MTNAAVQPASSRPARLNRRAAWFVLLLMLILALSFALIPVWLIQPFKQQSPRGLDIAYTLRRWSPLVTLVDSIIAFGLVIYLWRGARRWWKKTALVILAALTLPAAWLARQNHFEWMFNPLPDAAFIEASAADFVADSDKVLAIEINRDRVAYPIRQIAYHHVVQNDVGGVPIVATY
jgi:hypothetical protein